MAITIPIISEFADKGLKSAEAAFATFRSKVAEAEGGMGKFKAGAGVAMDYVKANSGLMAATAGAAIAGFALKAVGDFQDLALGVDKFRDATGLTLDQASRWTEVAGDINVDAGAIQTAINKMNKAAEKGEDYFAKLGVEMGKHKDGTYDPQQTFLNVIDTLKNIEDPADRAKIATELLGRGWMDMADLIERGSGELLAAMKEVGDEKIIDEKEVQDAQDFRKQLDDIKDAFEKIALKVGEAVLPVLEKMLDLLGPILKALDILFPEPLLNDAIEMAKAQEEINKQMENSYKQYYNSRINAEKLGGAISDLKTDVSDLTDEWQIFLGEIDKQQALDDLIEKFNNAREAAWIAFYEKTPEAYAKADEARRIAQEGVGEYIKKVGDIPADKQTEILLLTKEADFNAIEKKLNYLARDRTVRITPEMEEVVRIPAGRGIVRPMSQRTGDSRVSLYGGSATSGGTVTVNVMGSVTSERDLIEAIRQGLVTSQRNGAQLVYSNV